MLLQARNQGLQEYGTAVYDYKTKTYEQLLDNCGISDCKQAFCGGERAGEEGADGAGGSWAAGSSRRSSNSSAVRANSR